MMIWRPVKHTSACDVSSPFAEDCFVPVPPESGDFIFCPYRLYVIGRPQFFPYLFFSPSEMDYFQCLTPPQSIVFLASSYCWNGAGKSKDPHLRKGCSQSFFDWRSASRCAPPPPILEVSFDHVPPRSLKHLPVMCVSPSFVEESGPTFPNQSSPGSSRRCAVLAAGPLCFFQYSFIS